MLFDDRKLLLLPKLAVVSLIILKTLLGIEGQHFDLRHPFEDSHQGIDPAADGFRGVDGEVGGFYTEKHQLSMTGE